MNFLIHLVRKFTTLKWRLFLMFAIPGLIYYITSTMLSYSHSQSVYIARLDELRSVVESTLGQTSAQALARGYHADLDKVIQSLIKSTNITGIKILDIENNKFSIAGNVVDNKTAKYKKYISDIYHSPVVPDYDDIDLNNAVRTGEPVLIGYIEYYIDTESLKGQPWIVVFNDSVLLFIILILCSPLFYILYKSFSLPLAIMIEDIKNFEKGKVTWISKKPSSVDEFSRVTSAMRNAAETITRQTHQIIENNVALRNRACELEQQIFITTEAREAADKANAQKDIFMSNMSHEMRTPLAGVVSGLDLIEENLTSALLLMLDSQHVMSPEQSKILDDIKYNLVQILTSLDISKKSSNQLTVMVTDLLASIQDIYHDIHLRSTSILLYDSLDILFRSHLKRARVKGIDYDMQISGIEKNSNLYVRTDWIRISQILNNYINNAIHFTYDGGVKVETTINKVGSSILLNVYVIDTGTGINDIEKENIFKLFHIAEDPSCKKVSGMGIGLAISKRISNKLGGELNLDYSEVGRGSKFSFSITLPISKPPNYIKDNYILIEPQQRRICLLYVEDSSINRQIFSEYCSRQKIDLILANNGKHGLEQYKKHNFDALIIDCYMPIMNGFEMVREVRNLEQEFNYKHMPIFALSADASDRNRARCIEAGFDEFLSKPYTKSTIQFILLKVNSNIKNK